MTFLFEGFLYNITFNWVLFLIISIFIMNEEKIDIFILNDIKRKHRHRFFFLNKKAR